MRSRRLSCLRFPCLRRFLCLRCLGLHRLLRAPCRSRASGQECNFLKSQKDGGPLCRDSFERVVYEPPLYCYRTLGEIACYDKRDPDRRTTTEVR